MKIFRRLLPALLVAAAFVPVTSDPATALEGEAIVIRAEEGARIKKTYGPMVVPDAVGVFTHPGDCALAPSCTEIPLKVILPDDYDEGDEFFFNFIGSWEGNVDIAGTAGSSDLDFYMWALRPNAKGEMEWEEVGSAASAAQPERTRLFGLTETDYVITASNFTGAKLSFTIEMDFVDLSLPDDFDPYAGSTGRTPSGGSGSGSGSGSAGSGGSVPFEPSFGSPEPGRFTAPAPTSPASLAPVGTDGFSAGFSSTPGDAGLGDFGSFNQFQKDLNAEAEPTSIDLLAASRRQLGPAKDVGAPVLFFWLLALPLVIGALGLFALMRRRPAALTVSV